MDGLPAIDWALAERTGVRLAPTGPAATPGEAASIVRDLRAAAQRAYPLVQETSQLKVAAAERPVLVVDRPRWIAANIESLQAMLPAGDETASLARIGGAAEMGSAFAWLSGKVLGQFDPYGVEGGRLLLVAQNILAAERELDVDPADFRLWICLHEETHRVQFAHAPWLRELITDQARDLLRSVQANPPTVAGFISRLRSDSDEPVNLIDLFGSDSVRVRQIIDRVTAVMSLVEGHADVMMDRVGPEVIGSVELIRERFAKRRRGKGMDRIIRKVMGLDAKIAQYREGAQFCNHVIDSVGVDGLNRAFASPNALPTLTELRDPEQWIERMAR